MLSDAELDAYQQKLITGEHVMGVEHVALIHQAREANALRAEVAELRTRYANLEVLYHKQLPDEIALRADVEALRAENTAMRDGAVDTFCKAARVWRDCIDEAGDSGMDLNAIDYTFRCITKSNLLWRLIYGEKEPRTERCETHGGHWSGIPSDPAHACCDLTGWKRGPAAQRLAADYAARHSALEAKDG